MPLRHPLPVLGTLSLAFGFALASVESAGAGPLLLKQLICDQDSVDEKSLVQTSEEMLQEYRARKVAGEVSAPVYLPIELTGVSTSASGAVNTTYNPAGVIPTRIGGRPRSVYAVREEAADSEFAKIGFYDAGAGVGRPWPKIAALPTLELQDPFYSIVRTRRGKELVLGGVSVFFPEGQSVLQYETAFFRDRGKGIDHLEPAFRGPPKMKDIRLGQFADAQVRPGEAEEIWVYTRPQSGDPATGGRGKIAYVKARDLDSITPDLIRSAKMIDHQLPDEEWLGTNQIIPLKNRIFGIVGHGARYNADGTRFYYALVFAHDPTKGWRSPMKIILTRSDLPGGLSRPTKIVNAAKPNDLADVIFSSRLVRAGDPAAAGRSIPPGKAIFEFGEGDAGVGAVLIDDPMLEYERIITGY